MRTKRPVMCDNKRILFSFLVIALSAVIAVNCISDQKPPEEGGSLAAKAVVEPSPSEQKSDQVAAKQAEADPPSSSAASAQPDKQVEVKSAPQEASKVDSEAAKRKARSEQSTAAGAPVSEAKPGAEKAGTTAPSSAKAAPAAVPEAKTAAKAAAGSKPAAAASAGSTVASGPTKLAAKSKLPANLGTVTSTGSGGPAHYMSKHDAYSAIAEKHGALAQDAMRKSDKRQLQGGFGGIQKAGGGLGDMFGPFKSVSDSGLARTLGASMRSIMKSKYSVPAYVASALLGAVALMAFYESPISPLPVPALPEPPVGRFPPEMPNLPTNTQVPFRTNQQQQYNQQQQNYNQRSLFSGIPAQSMSGQSGYNLGQRAQQVLFPSNNNNNNNNNYNAQQRSQTAATGPVQLAANLLGGKQQIAQRKSGVDYDQSTSRSFFSPTGSANQAGGAQLKQGAGPNGPSSGADSSQQKHSSSLLNFFGLGNNASPIGDLPSAGKMAAQAALAAAAATTNNNNNQVGAISSLESKGQSVSLYNSNLVNKFKSFFTRSPQPASATSTFLSAHPLGPYDQYQRMSFVQALLKDNNFLPGFLSPSRKSSSTPTGPSQSASTSAGNKLQMVSSAIASATSGSSPTARMQVAGDLQQQQQPGIGAGVQQAAASKQKPAAGSSGSAGGFGFARAADRIAHVLLDTFTSGMAQRSAAPHSNSQSSADNSRKSSQHDDMSHSSMGSSPISSILTDVISSAVYSAAAASAGEQQQQSSNNEQVAPKSAAQQQSASPQQPANSPASSQDSSATGRSLDAQPVAPEDRASSAPGTKQASQQQTSAATTNKQQQISVATTGEPAAGHVRKTRSIGMDYAIETNQELNQREQQPSKAAQINSYIDLIADSYSQNRFLFNFVMNRVGLSHAVPYVEQILAPEGTGIHH